MRFRSRGRRVLSLALQGGGAHGAFTWGVLDRLLEEGIVDFDGVSGASAGAMNAVVLAQGLLQGGGDGARAALRRFWEAVAAAMPFDLAAGGSGGTIAPAIRMLRYWTSHFSPSQLNPFDLNPLREIVVAQIDFERLRAASPLALFVAATHANTGRLRLFRTDEIDAAALLASACVPWLHHPIEIGGEPYWDGAFAANPAVRPLVYECAAADVLLVLLSPAVHGPTPRSAEEIRVRSLDLAFNANLLTELESLAAARDHAARSWLPFGRLERRLRRLRLHRIEADPPANGLAGETRLATSLSFLEMLHEQGRARAAEWLAARR